MKFLLPVELQKVDLVNMLNLDDDETVTQILPVEDLLKISMSLWQLETVQ